MKSTQKFVLALGGLVLSITGNAVSGQSATKQCTSEECACEEALSKNTVEALEEFLKKYPHSDTSGASACSALGTPPPDVSGTSEPNSGTSGVPSADPTLPSSEG